MDKINNNYYSTEFIQGYENFVHVYNFEDYMIGDCGTVLSLKNNKIKPLVLRLNHYGYPYVDLCKNGIPNRFMVHNLVAAHFIINPDPINFTMINHLDGNVRNNYRYNLQWCNDRINSFHKNEIINTGIKGCENYNSLFTEEQVLEIYYRTTVLKIPYIRIAEEYGVNRDRIRNIAIGGSYNNITHHLPKIAMFDNNTELSCRKRVQKTGPQKGSARHNSILTEEQVLEIKILFRDTEMRDTEIANIYGVERKTINNIRLNKTWKHVML